MSSTPLPMNPGDIIASRYQVEHELGTGAVGAVVAATDLTTGTPVAIKYLLPKHAKKTELVRRFAREGYVAARLRSDHVVRIHHYGSTLDAARASGLPYIVMERLDGLDLASFLRRRGPLDPRSAADYAAQACCALAEAHALGLVHRDIKPGNLFLACAEGTSMVKLLDFGIAKFTSPNAAGDPYQLTSHHKTLGTPSYMSPEQLSDPGEVDARADIWSLGVTLFRLITGVMPFQADTPVDIAISIARNRPPALEALRDGVPPGLDAVVQRCLQKRKADRYRNATELHMALSRFVYRSSRTADSYAPETLRLLDGDATLPGLQPLTQDGR